MVETIGKYMIEREFWFNCAEPSVAKMTRFKTVKPLYIIPSYCRRCKLTATNYFTDSQIENLVLNNNSYIFILKLGPFSTADSKLYLYLYYS